MTRRKLLCVDDDSSIRSLYRTLLGHYGYEVLVAESGVVALNLLEQHNVDAVILDYEMPGMKGSEVAAEIKRRTPSIPILMISGCPSVVADAPRFVDAALAKGAPVDRLLGQLDMLLRTPGVDLTSPMPTARFAPLGSALATVALLALLLQRVWL